MKLQIIYVANKKHKIFLVVFLCVILVSCTNRIKIEESAFVENEIEVIKPEMDMKQFDISPILDTVKFLKLEISENSIIGEINKVTVFEDRIYILDKLSRSVFIFNMDGKFIFKISRVGHGPGEYTQLDFFDLNYDTRQIVLTDLMTYRVLCYDLEGKFVSEKKIPYWVEGLTPAFNNGFVAFANFRNNKSKLAQEYNVLYLDSMMNISKGYFPYDSKNFDKPMIKFTTPESGNFYTYKNNTCFFTPYNSTIYQITSDGLKPKYLIDFRDKSFNEEYLNQSTKLKNFMEEGEFYQIANVFENDEFVIFSFYQSSIRIGQFAYYSKMSGNVIEGFSFSVGEGNYFYTSNISAYDSWIIAAIPPNSLISWAKYVDDNKVSLDTEYGILKNKIASEITLEDNQLLMFYKLRQF